MKLIIELFLLGFALKPLKSEIEKFISNSPILNPNIFEIFNENEIKKIENDVLLIHLGILQPLALLLNRKPTRVETQLQILISICAAIQDSLIDLEEDNNYNKKVDLLKEIRDYLAENIKNKELFESYSSQSLAAQHESKQQFDSNISLDKIRELTFYKCGYAFLLIRSILAESLIENETKAILQYGYAAQIGDDILDLYDDIAINQHTLANRVELHDLIKLFNSEKAKTFEIFNKLNYPKKNVRKAQRRILVFLSVFNLGLLNFQKLKINTTDWGAIKEIERRKFIIDMDKFSSKIKLLFICLKYQISK